MRNGRMTRMAAMMIVAAALAVAGMAQAAPRRFDNGDWSGDRVPAAKARYEFMAGKRAGTDVARRAFADAARLVLLRINLHVL